jgi:hypothetical protein
MMKGTMESEASRLITKFGLKIGGIEESIAVMATHFVRPALALTTLDSELTGEAAPEEVPAAHDTPKREVRFVATAMKIIEHAFKRFTRMYEVERLTAESLKTYWWLNQTDKAAEKKRHRYQAWIHDVACAGGY